MTQTLSVSHRRVVLGAAALSFLAGLALPAAAIAADGRADKPKADITPAATMMRYPAVSKDKLAFVYANNIWLAPRDGGTALPLASPPGASAFPRFSPDGQTLGFSGNYDGNRDLYTIPVTGGVPFRVTHHPSGETLSGWTPAGELLFLSSGMGPMGRMSQLFTVPATGGLPQRLPMPYAGFGSVSTDGQFVAFTPHSTDTRTWKRYRGGMATDIWVMNLQTKQAKRITDWEGTDTIPMWGFGAAKSIVYYLSDDGDGHRLNIWSYDNTTGKRERVTNFTEDDVRWPSIGPNADANSRGSIIFQLGSKLMLLDLDSRQSKEVKVTIPGARPQIRPTAEDGARNITAASISPSGKRVAVVGRGDIFSVPAKEGVTRNLTRTSGVFERSVAWSPDGKHLAYFSDEGGEYDLYIRPSDARREDDDKPDAKSESKPDAKPADADAKADAKVDAKPAAKDSADKALTGPVKLTDLGAGFRGNVNWAPDSKHLTFTDNAGRLHLATLTFDGGSAKAEVKLVDTDPWGGTPTISWSHDSAWIAYTRGDEGTNNGCIWLYNVASGERTRVTSAFFASGSPAFDRKGEFLYYTSNRAWANPQYGDLDTTFIYANTDTIQMTPLRADLANPFAPKSDEEELKAPAPAKKPAAKPADAKGDGKGDAKPADPAAPAADDGVTGAWQGNVVGVPDMPMPVPITITIKLAADGSVSGNISTPMGSAPVSGTFSKASGELTLNANVAGRDVSFVGNISGATFTGKWSAGEMSGNLTLNRKPAQPEDKSADKSDDKKDDKSADKDKKDGFKIDTDGFEARSMPLPISPGSFGNLEVTHDNKLLYVRSGGRGAGEAASIKLFDPKDEAREEKTVAAAGGFSISADGKKLLVNRGGSISIVDAAPSGKSQAVSTAGMRMTVDPRAEWKQIFSDVWRLQRDYFYEPTLHNVDWNKMRTHYGSMIDDCANREDLNFIIAELISELNVGHAYLQGPGDVESGPASVNVGLLGCDFELVNNSEGSAYRISRIFQGGPWDSDARGPLSQPGPKKDRISVGDFILAVNGVPIDTSKDPWAAFIGLADRPTTLTISSKPFSDSSARDVLVRPISSDANLRFRDWIESNRKRVFEASNGEIGYIFVPDTGVNGQNELFRQFFGQRAMPALLIDERWNGGGQIPTRFIELLNRPVTNFWARRHGKDWQWPPDSHQGPKAMLINGLSGSGGDAFPAYFRQRGLGKLIGTRTWGGLVGISGNPGLIDGGSISVPTFGYYKLDGNWGIEGHGVDPDIMVIDDPSLMTTGGDPQLDAAIKHLQEELKTKRFVAPPRPKSPDRRGMGIPERDR